MHESVCVADFRSIVPFVTNFTAMKNVNLRIVIGVDSGREYSS